MRNSRKRGTLPRAESQKRLNRFKLFRDGPNLSRFDACGPPPPKWLSHAAVAFSYPPYPCLKHQPVASYSAGRDIAAETEPSTTGTKLDIAATDHIRPIATTTAIPTIPARICIPSTSR
jgi:hypothetical protein